ncbi:hypothetical protein C4K40_5739 [Pseudomonas sp. CMR5c]|nr:hypothetical protein C4K40_5739 [Pseudomonas sp. CMR5c]
MHNVPTLSHGTPLANNQGNDPTQKGVKPPQQQRHNQNYSHDNQRGLSGFLTGWPYDFTNLSASFFNQDKERLAFCSLQTHEGSNSSNNKQRQDAVQDRQTRIILITNNTNDHQSDNNEPLQQIEARTLSFSLRSHL